MTSSLLSLHSLLLPLPLSPPPMGFNIPDESDELDGVDLSLELLLEYFLFLFFLCSVDRQTSCYLITQGTQTKKWTHLNNSMHTVTFCILKITTDIFKVMCLNSS